MKQIDAKHRCFQYLTFEDNVNTIDMNIPLFEILILLFVLWPLIQRFLQKNNPEQGQGANPDFPYDGADDPFSDPGTRGPQSRGQQPDWDEAMKELEMIFTGERPSQPTPKEIERGTQRSADLSRSREQGTDRRAELQRQSDMGSSRREALIRNKTAGNSRLDSTAVNARRTQLETMQTRSLKQREVRPEELASTEAMVKELMVSENPIYTSLNDAPEIIDEQADKIYSVYSDVRDPQRLREFFVMKEILDKPVSHRNVRNFV